MCTGHKGIICAVSCLGLIQSVIWTGLGVAGALVYLGKITVQPYVGPPDFFRVTLAKLYLEGPNNIINGSYLGKLAHDYRNPNVIDLFWPDKVFAVLLVYVTIDVIYFFTSLLLYCNRNPKKLTEIRRLRDICLGWSCITLALCAVDVMLMYFLFRDFMNLKEYVNKSPCVTSTDCKHDTELTYIPLVLAIVSGRLFILWLWNFFIACLFLFDALCCKKILGGSFEPEKQCEREQKVVEPPKPPQVVPPVKLINKSYSTSFDIWKGLDSVDVKRSTEAVTNFSDDCGKTQGCRVYSRRDWDYSPSDVSFRSVADLHPKLCFKEWNAINEGYESDEDGSLVLRQTAEPDQNQEPKQKKMKYVRAPIGKRVSIPIPPPLPVEDVENERSGRADSSQRVGV